ncbi:hypothetical protein [Pedobacter sp. Hv1]|uniref:hypothetical protein n=1 Tax=Pedobacter sp. Hv1 TaxID=1740090 RepID=UPI0006D8B8FA|nr:hypothetical protein [Pedobacter sp. Hv1]KQC02794.1 hypothetical protein AQF98_04260 [Pedobacter sp. Hv1]
METKIALQQLDISSNWAIVRNVFYDIDPADNVNEEDKYVHIYCQEDLLYLIKDNYHLDLGWYGSDNLSDEHTGYCIHLFRGDNWNNAELLEKFRSKSKLIIVNKIAEFMKAIELGEFDNLSGYSVNESDASNENDFNKIEFFSVRQI